MVFHEVSYEAPPIFVILQGYFQDKDIPALKKSALSYGVKEDEFKAFLAYAAAFYNNMGNYNSFGSKKFIPEISKDAFVTILKSNPLFRQRTDKGKLYKYMVRELFPLVSDEIWALDKPYTTLGFPDQGGVTGFFGRNMNSVDLKLVKEFLEDQQVDILNTRAFKKSDHHYIVTVGSINSDKTMRNIPFKGAEFDLEYGEFSSYLRDVVFYLKMAKEYASNQHERDMIDKYVDHFKTGNISLHKDSQREWIMDKGPIIESNLGWIEHYVDPENVRAIWEGWVALVDKERSKKFSKLVNNSQAVL